MQHKSMFSASYDKSSLWLIMFDYIFILDKFLKTTNESEAQPTESRFLPNTSQFVLVQKSPIY